jgi:uncharacterized protein YecE (DUF72 family)
VATIIKWAEVVPSDFQFTFKLSKSITHAKHLDFNTEDVHLFMQAIAHVGNKKGVLLIQFPPGLKVENLAQLQRLLECISNEDAQHSWKIAIEFRNTSWYYEDVYEVLREYKASLVIHDLPASVPPMDATACSFRYLRFHGPGGRYRGSYDDHFLKGHAQSVKEWIAQEQAVYVYFNNTMGDAINNLQTLNKYVNS